MTKLQKLVTILVKPFQALETAFQDLLLKRSIADGTGETLNVIGRLVGQPRSGLSDPDYRRYLSARVATNRSTGKREELIRIARLIVNDSTATMRFEKHRIASIYMRVQNIASPSSLEAALMSFLGVAVPDGVRIIVQTSPAIPTAMFKFAGGGRPPGPGFDNSAAPGSGGQLADARDNADST